MFSDAYFYKVVNIFYFTLTFRTVRRIVYLFLASNVEATLAKGLFFNFVPLSDNIRHDQQNLA